MTGVDIVGALLRADAALVALVPIERIKAGRLPDSVPLPAVLLRVASSVDHQFLKRTGMVRRTQRVAATVRAASYREQVQVIGMIVEICADRTGDLAGAKRVAILNAGLGPDVNGPADSFEQTQDFRVSFDAPTTRGD